MGESTILYSCTKSKSKSLVIGHLGNGVSEEDELVIGPASILHFGGNTRHDETLGRVGGKRVTSSVPSK